MKIRIRKNRDKKKSERYFSIYYSLTNIISYSSKDNNNKNKNKNIIKDFIEENKNLTEEEKNLFVKIISFFTIYGNNGQDKIFPILYDLYESNEHNYFFEVYFDILYQLSQIENF